MEIGRCVHFNGIQNKICHKGVSYKEVCGAGDGIATRLPCNTQAKNRQHCDDYQDPTDEEIVAYKAICKEMFEGVGITRKAIIEETGGVRGRAGAIPCLVCKEGEVKYSVDASNGHVWAQCSTLGCVSWME